MQVVVIYTVISEILKPRGGALTTPSSIIQDQYLPSTARIASQVKSSQKYFIPTRPQYSMHKSETSTQSSKEKATQKGESR